MRLIPDIEYEAALLQFVRKNVDVRRFLAATGYDVVRFNNAVECLIQKGFLGECENKLVLTESGSRYYKYIGRKLGRRGLYAFMLPDYSVRKVQKSQSEIYIPEYMIRENRHFSSSYVLGRSGESSGDCESIFKLDK